MEGLVAISDDITNKPKHVFRFNQDSYRETSNKVVKKCLCYQGDKKLELVNEDDWQTRLSVLKTAIVDCIEIPQTN